MRLIDADALPKYTGYALSADEVAKAVENAPTIEERKRGRWVAIVKGERGYSAGDFRCSVCDDPCKCYHLTNFCPNCGADMRGEANEID